MAHRRMTQSWWYQRLALLVLSLMLASCASPLSSGGEGSSTTDRATTRPEASGRKATAASDQEEEEPGAEEAQPTVEPIERVLETTAEHSFSYAGMRFTLAKAVISNRERGEPARYSADSATMELTLAVSNENKEGGQLNDALLHVTMGDGERYEEPLRIALPARDSKEVALSFEVPTTTVWEGAELGLDELEREPVLLPLSGPIPAEVYPMSMEAGAEASIKTPELTYSVTDAQTNLDGLEAGHLARAHTGTRFVRLKVHVTSQGQYPAYVGPESFRLLVDGKPKAAEWLDPAAEPVNAADEKDFVATFIVPASAKTLALQVGEASKEIATISLDLASPMP